MGKKKHGHPDVEDVLSRPWCYYCERDFEDLKLLISHQKAKHFKCDRCGRRLNTAGGLSVHLNQVHKETLSQVENALPNRQGLEVEIFGMEGVPQDALDQHRNRIIQNFYQAQEDRRLATGNPLPGQAAKNSRKKIKIETADELLARFAEYRAFRKAGGAPGAMEGVVSSTNANAYPGTHQSYAVQAPPMQTAGGGAVANGLPQRPTGPVATGDDIDQLIRMAEAGAKPAAKPEEAGEGKTKKDKDKKSKMVYDDAEFSPEERMAQLPRYAFSPQVAG